MRKTFNLGRGR